MQFDFFKKPWVKSSAIAGAVGYFLSFLLVLIFGGGIWAVLIKPLLSALLMACVWAAVYFLLEKFVPDVINQIVPPSESSDFSSANNQAAEEMEDFNFDINDESISADLDNSGPEAGDQSVSEDIKISNPVDKAKKVKKSAGNDEIMVEGVPLKKDPDLMARAIQHVLDSEKE